MIRLHDLQDLRRRVLVDRRAVAEGALEGLDVLDGVVEQVEGLIAKHKAHAFPPGTSNPSARCPRCHRTAAEAWAGWLCDTAADLKGSAIRAPLKGS